MADPTDTSGDPTAQDPNPTPGDNPNPGDENSWLFSTDVPGSGDKPEWFKNDKYQTVADQAKAYPELEAKLGSFTGSPEEYAVNLADDVKELGLEITMDDPLVEQAVKYATEANMSQEGFDGMMNLYAQAKVAEFNEVHAKKQVELEALGEKGQERIDNLLTWGDKNLSPEMLDGFKEMAISSKAVETMEAMVAMTREGSLNPKDSDPADMIDAAEVNKMQFEKDEYGNRRLQTDPAFKAKYDRLRKQLNGAEPHRVMVGKK